MVVTQVGYSERGMINALCQDMSRDGGPERLEEFLSWCVFPFAGEADLPQFGDVTQAHLLIEQSFSDFGDADLLILLKHSDQRRQCVFVEAKVATDVATPRTIAQRLHDFEAFVDGAEGHRTNLFVQLYRKMRLAHVLTLDEDSPFEPHPLLGRQSLGNNCVVRRAAELLREYVSEHVWYLAVVPDAGQLATESADQHLRNFDPPSMILDGWNTEHLGFLSWETVHERCGGTEKKWPQTTAAFCHNQGQIFQSGPAPHDIRTGWAYRHGERDVIVVLAGERNCRVIPDEQDEAGRFPESRLVPRGELEGAGNEPRFPAKARHPRDGRTYGWANARDNRVCHVIVDGWSWKTCRVRNAAPGTNATGTFAVPTAELMR